VCSSDLGARPLGFEALIRWNSPDQGVLSPEHYMAVIENGNLIHRFTLWVLDAAVGQCKTWHRAGHRITVAVNISTRNLFDLLLAERIQQILSKHDFPPQCLELEVTENSIMPNAERSMLILQKIRNLGVSIVIDDFGTGYSSLSYVQKLPIDSLKIDQSFIMAMSRDDHANPIVESIIDMAHNMGITVTAEGVETGRVLDTLTGMQCDHVQGYYISRPMPAEQASQWLEQNAHAPDAAGPAQP
jgi:EAL domain-containing protein (putative c-di-GMP-specific phosphodiesterase class I)